MLQSIPGASVILIGLLISWPRTNLFARECSWPVSHKRDGKNGLYCHQNSFCRQYPVAFCIKDERHLSTWIGGNPKEWLAGFLLLHKVRNWEQISAVVIQGLKLGADSYSPELRSLVWIQTLDCCEFGLWLILSIRDPNVAWHACRPRNCAKEIIYDSRLGGKRIWSLWWWFLKEEFRPRTFNSADLLAQKKCMTREGTRDEKMPERILLHSFRPPTLLHISLKWDELHWEGRPSCCWAASLLLDIPTYQCDEGEGPLESCSRVAHPVLLAHCGWPSCVPAHWPAYDQGQAVCRGTGLTSTAAPPSLLCFGPGVQFLQTLFPADKTQTIPPVFLLWTGGEGD